MFLASKAYAVFRTSLRAVALTTAVLSSAQALAAAESPQAFTLQGRLLKEDGSEPITKVVDLTIGIYSPNGICLLYEETQTDIDLSSTDGMYSIQVGSATGASKRTARDPGKSMAQIFANGGTAIRASDAGTTATCVGGYTPASGDARRLRVSVTPQDESEVTLSPDHTLSAVPQAIVAETLQGLTPTDFIRATGSVTQASLLALTNGSDAGSLHLHDTRYVKLGSSSSQSFGAGGFSTTGAASIGTATPGAQLHVVSSGAATLGLIVQGATGQTASLLELRDSNGTALASFDSSGNLNLAGHQAVSMRLENLAADPAASSVGRVFFNTVSSRVKYDTGAAIKEFADLTSTQTLTGKTLDGGSNTFQNIPVSALASSVLLADGSVSLSGTLLPNADGTVNLGSGAKRFDTIFAVNALNASDRRLKSDIRDSDLGLGFVESLRPVSYYWKNGRDRERHYGLIAQELEESLQGASFGGLYRDPESGAYSVGYSELIAPVIKAIQEIAQRLRSMESDRSTVVLPVRVIASAGEPAGAMRITGDDQVSAADSNQLDRAQVACILDGERRCVSSGIARGAISGAKSGTVYYLGSEGEIRAAEPRGAFRVKVGVAINPTDLLVQIGEPQKAR